MARTRTSCKVNCDDPGARVFDVGAAWGPPSGAAAARSTVSWASATSAHGQEQQVVFTILCRPRAGGDAWQAVVLSPRPRGHPGYVLAENSPQANPQHAPNPSGLEPSLRPRDSAEHLPVSVPKRNQIM